MLPEFYSTSMSTSERQIIGCGAMILCSNSWKGNEGKARASGLLLSAVLYAALAEYKNCLSQNHKLFGYFLAAKSIRRKNNRLPTAYLSSYFFH
jgi:hypothetical protein